MELPYQVALTVDGGTLRCGGSIISPLLILTAAQCVQQWRSNPNRLKITAGTLEPSAMGGQKSVFEQVRRAEKIYVHEQYYKSMGIIPVNDIALIRLNNPLDFGFAVWNIRLPEKWEKFYGSVTASGWGDTEEDALAPPSILMYAKLPIMPHEKCKRIYREGLLNENMICGENRKKGACQGDTGGPATCQRRGNAEPVLCGVISMGQACKINPVPDIYTKVSSYLDWIETIQKDVRNDVIYDDFDHEEDDDEIFQPVGRRRVHNTKLLSPSQDYNKVHSIPPLHNRIFQILSDSFGRIKQPNN